MRIILRQGSLSIDGAGRDSGGRSQRRKTVRCCAAVTGRQNPWQGDGCPHPAQRLTVIGSRAITARKGQSGVDMESYHGEDPDVSRNVRLGGFSLDNLEMARDGAPNVQVIF